MDECVRARLFSKNKISTKGVISLRPLYIVITMLLFGFLIVTHELGHFLTAKLFGVKVNEFAVGMGPALFKKQFGETLYSLRLFPMGGFCAMEGETEESSDPRSFTALKSWKRVIILSAGAFMNLLTGFLALLLVLSYNDTYPTPVIMDLMDGVPYESTDGILPGDEIVSIDDNKIYFSNNVSQFLDRADGEPVDIELIRDGDQIEIPPITITRGDYTYEGEARNGYYGMLFETQHELDFATICKVGTYQTVDFARSVWLGLCDIATGKIGFESLTSIVGVMDIVSDNSTQVQESIDKQEQTAEPSTKGVVSGIYVVIQFMSLIAINLAIMNMLPLPALDGGHIAFICINGILKLFHIPQINMKQQSVISSIGLCALLILMAVVMLKDIIAIII